jgi:hypothetical protein
MLMKTVGVLSFSLVRQHVTNPLDSSAPAKAVCEQAGRVSSFTAVALQ